MQAIINAAERLGMPKKDFLSKKYGGKMNCKAPEDL